MLKITHPIMNFNLKASFITYLPTGCSGLAFFDESSCTPPLFMGHFASLCLDCPDCIFDNEPLKI